MGDITWRGREEIASGLAKIRAAGHCGPGSGRRHVRHVLTTTTVVLDGHHAATARCYWLLVSGGDSTALLAVGEYHDPLRCEPGGWRFVRRQVVTDVG
jgi:hypothetical protein